jgi:hypothetical protein
VEEDLASPWNVLTILQNCKKNSNFLKHVAQKQNIWKKSRQRLKLFSLLPPIASEHFRLAGGFSAKLRNSLQYNALVFLKYFLAAKEIK